MWVDYHSQVSIDSKDSQGTDAPLQSTTEEFKGPVSVTEDAKRCVKSPVKPHD